MNISRYAGSLNAHRAAALAGRRGVVLPPASATDGGSPADVLRLAPAPNRRETRAEPSLRQDSTPMPSGAAEFAWHDYQPEILATVQDGGRQMLTSLTAYLWPDGAPALRDFIMHDFTAPPSSDPSRPGTHSGRPVERR